MMFSLFWAQRILEACLYPYPPLQKRGCNVLKTLKASLQQSGGDKSWGWVEADWCEVVAAIIDYYTIQLSLLQVIVVAWNFYR
jgi:hypothetical protein